MKFLSTSTGRYTVGTHPSHWETVGQGKVVVKGLHAEFNNGFFDSELAQEKQHWSDEDRMVVETWLLNHPDFKTGTLSIYDPEAAPKTVVVDAGKCQLRYPIEEEGVRSTHQCENPPVPGEDFCQKHLDEFAKASA